MPALSILRPGMFTTVQDLGRWGFQSRGVPVSGAMDWYSHRLANRLLGNDPGMATLEVTLIGPHLRFEEYVALAVTGAEFRLTLDDVPVETGRVLEAAPGAILKFGARVSGARAYVAVAGGIDVPEVLGSRSTHTLTGMGGVQGRALKTGDVIQIGERGEGQGAIGAHALRLSRHPSPLPPHPLPLAPVPVRLQMIPVDGNLTAHVTSQRFRVSPQSNRMGYRLEGGDFGMQPGERISTAVPTGAIQVPPDGQPILLMNDHATTGGYAIAGAVITADLPVAGQLAPGDWVVFETCTIDAANAQLRLREAALGPA
jgi:antagonist of KipI